MRKYGRVDANQPQIIRDLRAAYGPDCAVDLSMVGGGVPDQLLGIQGHTILCEIKTDTGKLTSYQSHFHKFWNGGSIITARCMEDVVNELRRLNATTFIPVRSRV